jgi:hypothetical protein
MKQPTLQEQYNLLKEGKGDKNIFMKSVRRLFPNLVNNTTPYDSAITILKHKQIISEGIGGVVTAKSANPFINWAQFLAEEAKAEEKKPTKEVTDMETRGFDYKDKKNIDNLYGEAFLEGYYAEMKDPKNADKSVDELKEIVAKNMSKDVNYYMKNAAFGVKGIGYTDDLPGLKASKDDKMTAVKLKENMIKLTDLLNENLSGYVDLAALKEEEDKMDENARTDAEEEGYLDGMHDEKVDMEDKAKDKDKKVEKEGLENRLRQIEVAGNVAALEAKMNAIDEEIAAREGKLAMVAENDAIAEFINPTRIKEINREISELQKAQAKYGKLYEKVAGKAYVKKEVVDETEESEY